LLHVPQEKTVTQQEKKMIVTGLLITQNGVEKIDIFANDAATHKDIVEWYEGLVPAIEELHKKARERQSKKVGG